MNEMVLEQVELLVTRQLDGRLTDDELVELEEICAREPRAESLADHLRQDHQAVCAALQTAFPVRMVSLSSAVSSSTGDSPVTESRACVERTGVERTDEEHANEERADVLAELDRTYARTHVRTREFSWWHRLRPVSALAAGVAVLIGVGLAYWSGRPSAGPTQMAKAQRNSPAPAVIPLDGSAPGNWHVAAVPAPPGSMVLVHDTGAPAGWVKDDAAGGAVRRSAPEFLGVEHDNSVFLIELPNTDKPSPRY